MDALDGLTCARAEIDRRLDGLDGKWDAPTPCDGWTIRDLFLHLVGGNHMAALLVGGATAEEAMAARSAIELGDDPAGAWSASADAQDAALREPGALEAVLHHPRGDMPGAQVVDMRTRDLLIHAWDLARAVGSDEALDPAVTAYVWELMAPTAETISASGAFGEGPSGAVADDAPIQHRLLDLSGRRP